MIDLSLAKELTLRHEVAEYWLKLFVGLVAACSGCMLLSSGSSRSHIWLCCCCWRCSVGTLCLRVQSCPGYKATGSPSYTHRWSLEGCSAPPPSLSCSACSCFASHAQKFYLPTVALSFGCCSATVSVSDSRTIARGFRGSNYRCGIRWRRNLMVSCDDWDSLRWLLVPSLLPQLTSFSFFWLLYC